jgi:amino acid transporter
MLLWFGYLRRENRASLKDNQQERKLQRYKWLLNIMILAVVMNMLAILFITMEIADGFSVSITLWPATTEAGFFLVGLLANVYG